ncbi:MAG TPA: ATP-dependent DNA helicase RecG [Bacilli bacterium]|nr:MAG: ATP-dependent DNA helicase RecG [Tenericutes bacterium ADurb.Bin140]HOE78324.1 ATP-dependent DNA helicase RecG [Bacilli bacterium]HON64558.1 ATP-dependent DNA helicase RecG [Bacilli bacterium]HOR96661.1 ATP-dependent DNA helicase RecG [Bacilli bacterium]HPD12177.1 ATP-dependent DNA helicase RecG [Bacilli bacterium]
MQNIKLASEEYILARHKTTLKKQGIETVADLLFEFPVRYENFTVTPLKDAKLDEIVVLEGSVVSKVTVTYLKTKLTTLSFLFEVEGKIIRATIFNRTYLKNKLDYGTLIRVSGRFYQSFYNFTVNSLILCDEINRDIVPIYRIKDISESKYLEIVDKVFHKYKDRIEETLPEELLQKYRLISLKEAVRILHYPSSLQELEKAYQRFKYEELLKYQLSMKYLQYMRKKNHYCEPINVHYDKLETLEENLPYELTADQKKAIREILEDLKAPYPMNRLLQGEVGSGKTIVAMMAMLAVVSDGYQAAFMCPTEILSQQHYVTISNTLKEFNLEIALLTGSTPAKTRTQILKGLKDGTINIVVGTHALFQKDVEYAALGIVIADEEHRFGVRQRVSIKNKGQEVNYLKMSATPIPRTLAITAYGDTDISIIKTMPINRKQVITKYVAPNEKKMVINHMKDELKAGHQIYVVTPLIEESESLASANATEIYDNMKKYFAGITEVGLLHGRLKTNEKEEIMQRFLNKEIGILVATSIIEVGVNVINATSIVILGAERFGVATLHQLRGRVMRSDAVPYCFLFAETTNEKTEERLKMLENTTDGFVLAEYDLRNRGPGEFFGEKQSGTLNFQFADLKTDSDISECANRDSEAIINNPLFLTGKEYRALFEEAQKNYLIKNQELD